MSAGLSIYGMLSGASAQAEAAEKQTRIKYAQAAELQQRQAINEQAMLDQSEKVERGYGASFAGTGREGGGIGGILEIHKNTLESIELSRRESDFKAQMLRMGADIDTQLSSDIKTASYISGAGTVLTGAAQAYSLFKGPTKAPSLPKD